jgi:primosomal replication protein N
MCEREMLPIDSRKCSFFDLASAADGERGERLEVILKIIDDELSLEQVEVIRHRVKVGDVVHVRGFLERQAVHSSEGEALELLLHARDIVAVRPWKLLHPGETFVPVPTVREAEKAPPTVSAAPAASPADGQTSEAVRTPASGEHCKFWINSKTCQFGDKCEFAHERDAEAFKHARAEWLTQRLRLKRERAALDEDPLDPHGKMSKAQRAQVLGDWLVATVGVPCLSAGRGVLDIAGGRGDVSFELWNKRGIPCTLIDPVRGRA